MKSLLKKIFPVTLLRKFFYYYTSLRKKTVDRLLFPICPIDQNDFRLYKTLNQYTEYALDRIVYDSPAIQQGMDYWKIWTQEEYILCLNTPCTLEPSQGWAFRGRHKIISSLGLGKESYVQNPKILSLVKRKNVQSLSKTISLRDTGEENYFHFYNDIIAKLYFLQLHNIEIHDYQIVVAQKLWERKHFQFFLSRSTLLKSLNWYVQKPDEYIQSNETVFCKPITHHQQVYKAMLADLEVRSIQAKSFDKIYISRNRSRTRFVENESELIPILKKYGFEIIDSDTIDLEEQIAVFSGASIIIGIHGAGLTNLMFSEKENKVLLELFPPMEDGYLPFHYNMLAHMFGFRYVPLLGYRSEQKFSTGFCVDPGILETEIKKL